VFKKGITPGSEPHVIITDPTNSRFMWFTEYTSGHLARFDRKTHKIREFKLASKDVAPHGIVPDPNGTAMWWCEQRADGFGRLDLSNGPINTQADFDRNYKQFLGLPKGAGPHDPLFGPDNAIYTTLQDSQQLGRFDLKTEKFSVHDAGLAPYAGHLIGEAKTSTAPTRSLYTLAVSPDNKYIFFTVLLEGALGRYNIKTHQVVLIRHGITPGGGPLFVAPGPDGHLWFSEVNLNPIEHGRLARVTES
jgi:streptogramin lyase